MDWTGLFPEMDIPHAVIGYVGPKCVRLVARYCSVACGRREAVSDSVYVRHVSHTVIRGGSLLRSL